MDDPSVMGLDVGYYWVDTYFGGIFVVRGGCIRQETWAQVLERKNRDGNGIMQHRGFVPSKPA